MAAFRPDVLPPTAGGFENRIMYEVFIRSFYDTNKDGIGDINGLASRMGYLRELGVEGLWLMPISPSPTYHKYDVTDYYDVDSVYGTLKDFKNFVELAHSLKMKVVIDLVLNHCSNLHPWFLDAISSPKAKYRDYFVWSDPDKIKSEPEHWYFPEDASGKKMDGQKFYGFFWSGMPDLNYDNPKVREEMKKVGKFWLSEIGVDGFRLDAAQHVYPTGQEVKNHLWWQEFRKSMEEVKPDFFMVGEVVNSNKNIAPYLKKGLHAAFNFDLAREINTTVITGVDSGIVSRLTAVRALYRQIAPGFIDATFITNHDQDRIMSNVKHDVNKAKMAAALLFTLPGSPYIYYGEEIGMLGQKPDEMIREPFIWTASENSAGQTRWEVPQFSSAKTIVPLNLQQEDSSSIYHFYKKFIAFRRNSPALSGQGIQPVKSSDPHLLIFIRSDKSGNSVLVVHNLSDKVGSTTVASIAIGEELFSTGKISCEKGKITCAPYSTAIFELHRMEKK